MSLRASLTPRIAITAIASGGAAGLAAYVLDSLLVKLTVGASVPIRAADQGLYLLVGLVTGLVAALVMAARSGRDRGGSPSNPTSVFAVAFGLVYVPALAERLSYGAMLAKWDGVVLPVTLVVTVLAVLLGLELLARIAGSYGVAGALLAFASAVILALNRNILGHPFSTEALLVDSLLFIAVALAGWAFRSRRIRLVAGATIVLFSIWLLVLQEAGPTSTVEPGVVAKESSNLLLIVVDTLRYDVFDEVVEKTPEGELLRPFLAGSTWFENAISSAPWTAPSVASIMTGLYPAEHGVGASSTQDLGRPLRALGRTVPTLAAKLRARGYSTSAFVTNPLLHPASGLHRGFDRYELLPGATEKLPLLTFFVRLDWRHRLDYQNAAEVRHRVESFIASDVPRQPFFWWVHFLDPHTPLRAHPELSDRDDAEAGMENLYRREVRFTVREVAKLLETLAAYELLDNTLVVLTADHGEMLPSDRRDRGRSRATRRSKSYGHGHALYDELVRVPLLIRPPGARQRASQQMRRSPVLTSQVDLVATVTDLLGIEEQRDQSRFSLASEILDGPLVDERVPTRQTALIGWNQRGLRQSGLRTAKHKLINYAGRPQKSEVFDLHKDPRESQNLEHRRADLLGRLKRLLRREKNGLAEPPESTFDAPSEELQRALRALGYIE